ncbi:MAG: polysaccharide deacetylase family protein [Candidatus Omnitrophica bacterium]|nr:polysaccharide deacetylase family protein [Candidatus Omnitrophota bacterium]
MYHHVGYTTEKTSLYVTPETFERQMEFLKVHGYRVLPLAELVDRIHHGKNIPWNAVVITFDDGHVDNFNYAFPVLKKMNFPAAIFVITHNVNQEGWLTEEDLKILDESGLEIGSHTVHHAYLPKLKPEEAVLELTESKKALEEILGHPITLLSYPAGGFTEGLLEEARKAGYKGAVTTNHGLRKHNPYALHRIKITERAGNLFNFWVKLTGLYQLGKERVQTQ